MAIPEPVPPGRRYRFVEDLGRVAHVPPPATLVLFLATVITFLGQLLGGSNGWQRAGGIIPVNVADLASFLRVGDGQLLPTWLTLFSYMLLHGGVSHLLANMTCLWVFGLLAEPVIGTKRFAFIYVVFGLITGITIVAIIPSWTGPMVGASGAISGILGAFLALHFSARISQGRRNVAVLLLEAVASLAVVIWFIKRPIPLEPDRPSACAWHLIPFMLAWSSMRIWIGIGSIRPTHADDGFAERPVQP